MKTNSTQAVREIAKDTIGAHLMGSVIEKTRYLFDNMEVQHITDLLNDIIFYVSNPDCAYIDDYNGGKFPYLPRPYKYLSLAVDYAKERDTAIVEVAGCSFEPHHIRANRYAFWVIVYHLGRIVEVHRKTR